VSLQARLTQGAAANISLCEGVGQYHRLIDSSPPFWLNRNCRLRLGEISIA
jgi:hypothetical protein